MSWDIYIKRAAHAGLEVSERDWDPRDEINLTYNLSPMLSEAGFPSMRNYDGRLAREVGKEILELLDRMAEDPDRWRALNPANGWGSYDQCLQRRLRAWAEHATQTDLNDTVTVW